MGDDARSQFQIVMADLARDNEAIVKFWRQHFQRWPAAKFDQFYLANPAGEARCWLARAGEADTPVAAYALFPRRVSIAGTMQTAGICGDMGADASVRGHGVGRSLQQAARHFFDQSGWSLLYGTANKLSRRVLTQEDFITVGESVRLVRVLNSKAVLRRRPAARPLAAIAGPLIDWNINRHSAETDYRNDTGHELVEIDYFDDRFDQLYQSARSNFPIIGDRGAEFLNWRFATSPQSNFRAFAVARSADDTLVGYIVLQLRHDIAYIEDLCAIDDNDSLRRVLGHAILRLKQTPVATISLSFFGGDRFVGLFREFGFRERQQERSFVLLAESGSPHYPLLTGQENWFFFHADNDVDARP